MKRYPRLLFIVLSLAAITTGQDGQRRIGESDFYGHGGLGLDSVRAALPVCCDERGDWMIYVGLPGRSLKSVPYNPTPRGAARLPPEAVRLYEETTAALSAAVRKGAREDDSRGYAVSAEPTLRARQRAVAAHFLGYARQSGAQIAALVRAGRDADETVRNNAVRALGVLAGSNPMLARRIPAAGFIELLNSGSWTDRNKGAFLLERLSKGRERKLLGRLRSQALESLVEMARWRSPGHAYSARLLLGRIAGIEETRLRRLVDAGQADAIISG